MNLQQATRELVTRARRWRLAMTQDYKTLQLASELLVDIVDHHEQAEARSIARRKSILRAARARSSGFPKARARGKARGHAASGRARATPDRAGLRPAGGRRRQRAG